MNVSSIKKIKDFNSLVYFLSTDLKWPIDLDNVDFEDMAFDYTADEIGLSNEYATKVIAIKQLQPLNGNQPWSVFWIDFENKRLPLTVLRRILNAFVTKKRANTKNLATKAMEDIMFVSGHGDHTNRGITFAHFKKLDDAETLREFYWDQHEVQFNGIANYLESLEWPKDTTNVEAWREKWKRAFTGSTREAISTSKDLATAMAGIAKNIRDRVLEVLSVEVENGPVHKLYDTFRVGLVHDMTEKGFADMYAQTITYGLFSARTMDVDGHFELQEVIDLIPQTNPFLKTLFKECLQAGDTKHKIDLDELGVGSLVDLFDGLNRSDGTDTMQRILAEFGRQTHHGTEDPVIHFYENFLTEYDKTQKVEKGVFYTPDPVVSFIVRSVNEQLKSEFGLEMGLADTTTWAEMVHSGRAEYPVDPKTGKLNNEWKEQIKGRAFVQILDPATGTGTFLKHVIEVIHQEVEAKYKRDNLKTDWLEYWNIYVYRNLLPRIYGFELMMAPYTVAHMKIGMYLKSLGYKFEQNQRLNIYLTNSLEPHTANLQANFFFTSVGAEAAGANNIKQNRYFSVVLGNPPYSGISKNKDPWITKLIEDYKYVDGEHFNERKHWLGDDYVKFIRLGESIVERNGTAILAYINPHGFLDNPTFRGMRWHLIKTYDKIYTLDLHGYNKKNETALDGSVDENVFDIMQGVSINLFIKTGKKKSIDLGKIFHYDKFGKRVLKYDFLLNNSLKTIDFIELNPEKPFLYFVPKSNIGINKYKKGFRIDELFQLNGVGMVTARDKFCTDIDLNKLKVRINKFADKNFDNEAILNEFGLKDTSTFKLPKSRNNIIREVNLEQYYRRFSFRPFDERWIFHNNYIVERPIMKVMQHYFKGGNIGLVVARQCVGDWQYVFCTKVINEFNLTGTAGRFGSGNNFPLYLYPVITEQQTIRQSNIRTPNLKPEIINQIAKSVDLTFSNEKETIEKTFAPIDILDYIYAVLHSPTYREKYKEFLKSDFPRIPYPKDTDIFWRLVALGGELRQIHLLESDVVNDLITLYPINGDNVVTKKASYEDGKVWINKTQYFDGVPQVAWEFYIGGYQPAQKWLKDRKDCVLSAEEIAHYQKIIVALTETDRIMKEIDEIEIE